MKPLSELLYIVVMCPGVNKIIKTMGPIFYYTCLFYYRKRMWKNTGHWELHGPLFNPASGNTQLFS